MKKLYYENFEDFNLDEFPYDKDHSALGEYHHIVPEGYMGNFFDPVILNQWRLSEGTWLICNHDGKKYLEQNRGYNVFGKFSDITPLLILNDEFLKNYEVETEVVLYSTEYHTGLTFSFIHSQRYLAFRLNGITNKAEIYYKNQLEETILKSVDFNIEALVNYKIKLVKNENIVKVYINDVLVLETKQDYINIGYVGFISTNACRYSYLSVNLNDDDYKDYLKRVKDYNNKLLEKQQKYPKLVCIKKINLKNFGSGRQFRTVRNHETNELYFIFVQHHKRITRDSHAHISCITCVDLEGNVKWQIGEPSDKFEHTLISCDMPIQVADINNDGVEEVIFARNFEVNIINAITGELIKKMRTPYVKGDDKLAEKYPFDYLNVDAIRVADFSGKGYKGDFIIKDRYKNVWAFDYDFNLLWRYHHKNTGHFPYIYDFDGDGRDEMYVGYDLVKDGKIVWSLPYDSDHTDEIIYESLEEGKEKYLILASGNEGFNVVDIKGNIVHSVPVGHAQRVSIAKFDSKREGHQVCVTSYWGSPNILYTFDKDIKLIKEKQFIGNGHIITPINYDNSDNALIISNTSVKYGGLLDVDLDVVVKFPDDGHPDVASESYDIDNDGVDEILTWDNNSLWIYKAETVLDKKRKFRRYPHEAFSNYRGEFLIEEKE